MAAKKHIWKDMSLAPVETHLLLWNEKEGIHIGIYRMHEQWNNWYKIQHTNPNHGCYTACNPEYWMHLPKAPDESHALDNHGYLRPIPSDH